ncbi:MAG: phosphoglycerate dehydrogenase [Planctomycetes bacterium]|nr:phosphoglycerate dehydrogenase [Planctomycetota bacterium]HJO27500.1 phosphoglycerate dehydrogenase [Planctomycetota bacterium]
MTPAPSTSTTPNAPDSKTSSPWRVLICDELSPAALAAFSEAGIEPEIQTGLDESQLVSAVPGVHALIVRSATKITRKVIEAADTLRVVGRAGTGVDNVDCAAATERGVVVMNTPTGNTTTTAELAVSLLCAIARHIPRADRTVRSGTWKKKGLLGTELTGKTVGIIGMGRIGRTVASRVQGLRMEAIGHDPYLQGTSCPVDGDADVPLLPLEELLSRSDFVTLHIPRTDSTANLLNAERIALMRPGARLINAARGGLVDEQALAEALDSGRLAGAALDVLAEEPPGADNPLVGREDVILTPHLGASSHEAQHKVAVGIARQISQFLIEGVADNAVNAPALPAETRRRIAPYVMLLERMGSFLAQHLGEPARKLELTLAGEIAAEDTGPLESALLTGLLRESLAGPVNFVNAPHIARERGLRVLHDCAGECHGYQSLVKVRASARGGEPSVLVTGTVFGTNPRFVRIDDLHLDLNPRGLLLLTRHSDSPGVLGTIGTLLGEGGVNIRRVELGTPAQDTIQAAATHAAGFFSLDNEPAPETLAAIAALAPIESVRLVRL